jgi:drug/metabolite transporter (DMT)-like permease
LGKLTRFGVGDLMALGAAACFAVYLLATERVRTSTITSASLLTQGPLTAVIAALLLGEPLTGAQIVGGALVLSGVGLAHRQRHPEEEANI